MQTIVFDDYKTGIFIREIKNRFLCEVEIDSKIVVCYVPSSCHLSNFLNLYKKKVLLVPTRTPNSRTPYALFAVPYKQSYIVLNTSMANRVIEADIKRRFFSYLGKRENVMREYSVSGYKCDLYIKDTDTMVEIKSIISTNSRALFPTVYSERAINQLLKIQEILQSEQRVCFCIVSLHPYVCEIVIDQKTEFYIELKRCINLGMLLHGYTTRFDKNGVKIEHEIPISFIDSSSIGTI